MESSNSAEMILVDNNLTKEYETLFEQLDFFQIFLNYVQTIQFYKLYIDSETSPQVAVMYHEKTYVLFGKSDAVPFKQISSVLTDDCWIIGSNQEWCDVIEEFYQNNAILDQGFHFRYNIGNINSVPNRKQNLSEGYQIEKISGVHLFDGMNMINQTVISKNYQNDDFLSYGFGFVLLYQHFIIGFVATKFPIINGYVELYIHIEQDNMRNNYLGIKRQLVEYFVKECIKLNYDFIWNCDTDQEIEIAEDIGYIEHTKWKIYHKKKVNLN